MKKDLNYLNTKWWYRLLKVIFVFVFVISATGIGFIAYDQNRPHTQDDYIVQCNYGTMMQFAAFKDKGIEIPVNEVGDGSNISRVPEYVRKQLQDACGISDDEVNKILNSLWDDLSLGKALNTPSLWSLHLTSYTVSSQSKALLYGILALVPVVISFEIIRIVFFYIATGSFFPNERRKYFLVKNRSK